MVTYFESIFLLVLFSRNIKKNVFFLKKKGEVFDLLNKKQLLLSSCLFIEMSRKGCFT